MEFRVYNRETNKEVSYDDVCKEDWAKNLIYCDIEGWMLNEDMQLMFADECGNFVYVPAEEKYLVKIFINEQVIEFVW